MNKDIAILKELARQWAEIVNLPQQKETRRLWKQLNMLKPERPMAVIDQIPWHEMNVDNELTNLCEDPSCIGLETFLRQSIYKWKHMPCDMFIDDFIRIPAAISNFGYNVVPKIQKLQYDELNTTSCSQHFEDIIKNIDDAKKIDALEPAYIDEKAQERIDSLFHEVFDGLIPLKRGGLDWFNAALWDFINEIHDIQLSLVELIDNPDFIHFLLGKVRDATLKMLDQAETLGVIVEEPSMVHCTGAYVDWNHVPPEPGKLTNAKNSWIFGMSQIFASVGPDMHEEFEYPYLEPIFKRFGYVYYGCCEPLHNKISMIRKYSNVRKISISPWADVDIGAANIGKDYVLSNKPNPAFVAKPNLDEDEIRNSLQHAYEACKRNGTPLEFILKDISTVRYQPQRLWKWAQIATEVIKQDC